MMSIPDFESALQEYSEEELTGKGNPSLFGKKINLKKEVHDAFLKMKAAALKEGIAIKVESGYRSFYRQKSIWERKYLQYANEGLAPENAITKIIDYSTIPGTSRHHWGTDMDIIDDNAAYKGDVLVPEKFDEGNPFYKLKKWMDEHAPTFGFFLVYTNNPERKGFKYEPWHYSYAPVAIPMLKAYQKLDLRKILREEALSGSAHFSEKFIAGYIKEHLLDINPRLLP